MQTSGTGNVLLNANLPVGGVVTISAGLLVFPRTSGTLVNTVSVRLGPATPTRTNNAATDTTVVDRTRISDTFGSSLYAGSDAGVPAHVKVFDAQTDQPVAIFLPFGNGLLGGVFIWWLPYHRNPSGTCATECRTPSRHDFGGSVASATPSLPVPSANRCFSISL